MDGAPAISAPKKLQGLLAHTAEKQAKWCTPALLSTPTFFWIPLFPYVTEGASVYAACEVSTEPKTMDRNLTESYDVFKSTARIPIWTFAGVGIIAILAAVLSYDSYATDANTADYIEQPAAGDMVQYKTETGNYSLISIDSIFGDSMLVTFNDYETDKRTGLSDIDQAMNYTTEQYFFHKSLLSEIQETGDMIKIERE